MTVIAAMPTSTSVLEVLANSAARALVLAGAAGLVLAAFRVKSTTARLFTWTATLYASLAMPVLQWVLPPVAVPVPAVFRSAVFRSAVSQSGVMRGPASASHSPSTAKVYLAREDAAAAPSLKAHRTGRPQVEAERIAPARENSLSSESSLHPSLPSSFLASVSWSMVATWVYFSVALFLLVRFAAGLAFGRRLLHGLQMIDDPRVTPRSASHAQTLGLASVPLVAESELISVPLTLGVLRSTILLPAGWQEWDDSKLDSVLAHELSHVARRDALTQHLSLLHRAIFWFSPLAWWLDRRLADLAEQASDEVALSCGADRKDYAKTLLEFFEALHAAPGRVWWQGVAMAKAGQAEKRLERILSWKGSVAMRFQKSIAVVVLALAVPLVYLVSSVRAASQSVPMRSMIGQDQTAAPRPAPAPTAQVEPAVAPEADSTPPEPAAPPEPAPAAVSVAGGVSGGIGGGISGQPPDGIAPVRGVSGLAPVAPVGPISALPPMPRAGWYGRSSQSGSSSRRGYSYAYGYDDEQRFVIVSGKTDALTMSGSSDDAHHVEKLRKTIPGDFIWFQHDDKSYVIRDQATIDRAKKLWAPQEELGKKQEELGAQQEALGKQQEELGAKMEQVRVNVPDITPDLDKLKAELKKLSSGATVEQVGEIQSEIGELQSKIGVVQSQAGDKQGNVGALMGELGRKQGKLGEQQGELGRQQGELAREATRQMKQLLDEAIAKGIAQPEL
jgi:beta-lactamase regulating signal transducer with metallopeptidase domain